MLVDTDYFSEVGAQEEAWSLFYDSLVWQILGQQVCLCLLLPLLSESPA